jgi:Domain of unknown function (DUF4145)
MKRSLWQQFLNTTACPGWTCPACRTGSIALVQKSLKAEETIASKNARKDDDWDPEWLRYTFTAWAECRHPPCKQKFAIAGTGGVGQEYDEEGVTEWREYFAPLACHPMPDIIDLPPKCPEEVSNEVRSAFALFWAHPEACAGRIRVALEGLMTHLGVPKERTAKTGKVVHIDLHDRIDIFSLTDAGTGTQLMALKWLGNAGSHGRRVSRSDLLDAFEIMEHALVEIIDGRAAKVAALAKKLTAKHSKK